MFPAVVSTKAPNLINLRIFDPREDKEYVGVTVACGDIPILQATNFWPRPIYVRAWNFDFVRSGKPSQSSTSDLLTAVQDRQDQN